MKRTRATAEQKSGRGSWPEPCCTLDIDGRDQERLVAMFKALANPIRFQILKFLLTHPGCITGDIVDALPIAQATVSQHLKVMREAGWIVGATEGPAICYELNREAVGWFRDKVGEIF
ncbi:MAG TPA: metalloregulator ArsR/SmtB family transcription factor [Thermoanaerobaculales bacterium]|nr:metalloregulator ArsR/SmtB family transcription factor [Thermoanaerobaculales bacterium]HPA82429.1 metalloregulator ArsR/SmtB family transcription factor [Thermoanaerobaculales bacterium]HQN95482.1 metalloregulator ArsR/SmtB family transcription factor [Thermoanaerobaculales bacterium]HQP42189.1 metalloregulator ArsR/SmtB family transcription factor [Thermoanaerobaculales bacterium]